MGVVTYRISYRDRMGSLRLLAVAVTLDAARAVLDTVVTAVPGAADRIVITEDPLLGVASRVVQQPQSLDAAAGLSVVYLGGTLSADSNWQARAIAALRGEPVVIANPRRERPVSGDDEELAEIAWRRRHMWRADIALFWFEGDVDPITLLEFGTQLTEPIPMAVGVSPDYACRAAVRAHVGHTMTELRVHDTLDAAASAAAQLVQEGARPPIQLPHHDGDPAASAMNVQLGIAGLKEGPGLQMRLNELLIEVGCAAGNGIDAVLLAGICTSVDRLRLDPDDPLGWAALLDAGRALERY